MRELIEAHGLFATGDFPRAEALYRKVAQADPNNGDVLHRLGIIALQRNDPASAATWLQQAVSTGSRDAKLFNRLGASRAMLKQFDEAIACFRTAAEIEPGWADARYNCGNALSSQERLDEAVAEFRAAAALKPESPEIHYNLANALRDLGRLNDAVAGYWQVLRLRPDHLKAINNLGNVLREQGKLSEAVETYRGALAIKPSYAQAHFNLGIALMANNSADQAIAEFREVLRLAPDHLGARSNLGKALIDKGQLDEAQQILEAARSQGENNIEAQLILAEKLRQAGRFDEAAACIQTVIDARADCAAAHNNLGLVWFGKQDFQRSIESYRQAIRVKPDFAEAINNLAIALIVTGDVRAGLEAVELSLRIKPDFAVAHLNRAVAWLQTGNCEAGWHEFEWRRLCDNYRIPPLAAPLWDGSASPDRRVLLHSEQGLGDTLQFIRYAPLVKQRCAGVFLQCQAGLAPLLSRCPGSEKVIARGETLPEFHLQAPLMSLPEILGTTLETIPAGVPYVFADRGLTDSWRQRLASHEGVTKVGIGWQGNRKYFSDSIRSIPLRHFAPLAGLPQVKLFSLQRDAGREQIAALGDEFPVIDFGLDFDTKGGAFMDTAAIMQNLDLIITSDTSLAHLAGALGVEVWVALGYSCDWRWLVRREDCPWYPTMRLFRQARLGDWDELFGRIATELKDFAGGVRKVVESAPVRKSVPVEVSLSPGELFDKLSILEIKRERVSGHAKLRNVCREWEQLRAKKDSIAPDSGAVECLYADLRDINRRLWDIEDAIRQCESRCDFGPRFIELARSVYRTNDERFAIKRRVNEALGCELCEEKQYQAYV